MEIRQLKYFVAIADTQSFSEASRRCFLSQSAISQQIKVLEDELGTSLFVRTPHKVSMTESGKLLLPLAKKAIESMDYCKERMADINKMLCGELNIGMTYSLESYLRQYVIRFMAMFPKVRLNIYYKTIAELIKMLREGELDLAFSIIVEGEKDWVCSEPVLRYRHCAVMRDTHALSDRDEVSFADLEKQSLIIPEAGMRDTNAIEKYLKQDTGGMRIKAAINDPCAILNLLKRTSCVSILPELVVEGIDELVALPIKELPDPVTSYVHTLKNGYQKKSVKTFIDLVKGRGK